MCRYPIFSKINDWNVGWIALSTVDEMALIRGFLGKWTISWLFVALFKHLSRNDFCQRNC